VQHQHLILFIGKHGDGHAIQVNDVVILSRAVRRLYVHQRQRHPPVVIERPFAEHRPRAMASVMTVSLRRARYSYSTLPPGQGRGHPRHSTVVGHFIDIQLTEDVHCISRWYTGYFTQSPIRRFRHYCLHARLCSPGALSFQIKNTQHIDTNGANLLRLQKLLISAGTITLTVGVMLGGLLSESASAEAMPATTSPHIAVKSYPLVTATVNATFARRSSTGFLQDVPPLGGCLATIQFSVTATYEDGVLADTQTPFFGDDKCTTTAAGQTLQHMSVDSQLWIGSSTEKDAGVDECSHLQPSDSQCIFVDSTATDNCFAVGVKFCNGDYFAQMFYTLLLPAGWVWTSAPAGCTINANVELDCKIQTNTVPVSEFNP
jgi:hypothetical protein